MAYDKGMNQYGVLLGANAGGKWFKSQFWRKAEVKNNKTMDLSEQPNVKNS